MSGHASGGDCDEQVGTVKEQADDVNEQVQQRLDTLRKLNELYRAIASDDMHSKRKL